MVPFVARQPIFDSRKKICAYELLFHSGTSSGFPDPETETAGSGRFHPSFFTVGIDRITGGHKAFVGFSEDQLIKNSPALFPLRNIIVELKEGVDPTADVIKACHFQVERGYTLAIGTSSFKEELLPLIEISRIVKVDFGLTPLAKSQALVNHFGSSRCKMFADNLKTHEEFHQAVDMGFDCFQGFFFSRPEILKNTDLTDPQLKMIRLINEINTEGIDSSTLVRLINRDVSIPFKLIKYLGCPCFKRIQPITSTRQAVSFLGNSGVRKLVSLVAVAKLGEHKPNELIRTAIIRARFLEQTGEAKNSASEELFMLGLFSLIDAIVDHPMEHIMSRLPLSDAIKEALIIRSGRLFPFLVMIENYERGRWVLLEELLESIELKQSQLVDYYLEGVDWADAFS